MIYIFGDSHAHWNMKNFDLSHIDLSQFAITMYRIGRDNIIINFNKIYNFTTENDIFIFFYGEIDCRCHIYKQLQLGRSLDEITDDLVSSYLKTISNNITKSKQVIIGSITPPICKSFHESIHGIITHEFPILGSDEERVKYTKLMNIKLKEYCSKYNYTFLDIYDNYSTENGLLIIEKSDKNCHIIDNKYIHDQIKTILKN